MILMIGTIRLADGEGAKAAELLAARGQADTQKAFGRALRAHGPRAMRVKAWDGAFWRALAGDRGGAVAACAGRAARVGPAARSGRSAAW